MGLEKSWYENKRLVRHCPIASMHSWLEPARNSGLHQPLKQEVGPRGYEMMSKETHYSTSMMETPHLPNAKSTTSFYLYSYYAFSPVGKVDVSLSRQIITGNFSTKIGLNYHLVSRGPKEVLYLSQGPQPRTHSSQWHGVD